VEGCHGCTVEGYALSYPDNASLMDVALIAEPFRRPDGAIDRTADDVGEVLGEREHTIERQFLSAVLWKEARKPSNIDALARAYARRFPTRPTLVDENSTYWGRP
jgi:hypothetical protein